MLYEGNLGVEGLSVANRGQSDEVASLQTLSLKGVRVTVDLTTVSIKEVGLGASHCAAGRWTEPR